MPIRGTIVVDEDLCKACELCVVACPQHVIALNNDVITPRGFHPALLAKDGCTGCGICALVCPEVAITVYREKQASN
ncbi:MAG: 4Fe-4S binding protein [Anaerolineaceae bacterium]|nr:4Fe-4S binding protein [Anaerolineaceae bacterium]